MKHLSRFDIEAIADKYVQAYMALPDVRNTQIYRIDPELLLEKVLGLNVEYQHLSYDGSILGMTSFTEMGVQVFEDDDTVVVAAITAVKKKTAMNTHIELNTDCGLKEPSMVMLEQLRTVDKATELDNFVGRITDADKISEIKRGLKFAVGIPVKPKTERKGIVLSLCPRCRSEFQSIPENIVKRLDPFQADKEMCDKCQVGYGYDYMIFKKNHHHAKGGVDNV